MPPARLLKKGKKYSEILKTTQMTRLRESRNNWDFLLQRGDPYIRFNKLMRILPVRIHIDMHVIMVKDLSNSYPFKKKKKKNSIILREI